MATIAPARRSTMGTGEDAELAELLRLLKRRGYRFVAPTPATHARILARGQERAEDPLRDLLGWSRPVPAEAIGADVLAALEAGGALAPAGDGRVVSRYRVSAEGADLYLHSAYPTDASDAVFFGPDSYRFAAFIRRKLSDVADVNRLAEIGAGSGVGAMTAARRFPGASVTMTDINPEALRLARINAAAAGLTVETVETRGLEGAPGDFHLIVANPPYMIDPKQRAYRDGGGLYGAQLAVDWAKEAMTRLAPGGRLLLYSGAPIVAGEDVFRTALRALAARCGARMDYEEIDPDVWGEELERPQYRDVERIAVAGATLCPG